ncbi:alpha amylase catalytic region [Caldithrix abyssi DSM 13497]|uniref:Alpha amylase catalytic region n=1 Tax=Caldithrix abyssi DSM 13497 TaxID=880073 RepID=H1XQW3_CALAY|nr:glycoside hydrolase family 13 protein [Caldithrix abyssi]APF18375.1 Glycosidase [Caldithrix abyssi DSM 13497]EHO42386.1 alpha amylase catalytic region [Caldithrix abyssi DSM 13497]
MRIFLIGLFIASVVFSCASQAPQAERNTDWASGIVWYQIFPERFNNGDPANDPTADEVPGADLQPGWQIHPWTSDWYKMQPWEKKQSDRFYDVVFTRRYGGDLIGVIEKLDYLKELGVEAIYFNPVFEAPSLHKYDGSSYHHIDNNFGPDAKGDMQRLRQANETEDPSTWIWTKADSLFLQLIKEAHARGIKIVIDGVFNHTGTEFFAFQDVIKNQQNSHYAHWYSVVSWDDPTTPQNEFDYKGWWGVKTLPELKEDENGIVDGPRQYIFNATRRWMDPNGDGDPSDGIDGWRLDVAEEVAKPFWKEWYALVKKVNPGAIVVTEIWHDASGWIAENLTDATMNYMFSRAVMEFFINHKMAISAEEFAKKMNDLKERYGLKNLNLLWSMLDSHDTDRLASMILNPDRGYDRQAGPRDNPQYVVRKPNQDERDIQKLIVAFQMTFAGAPIIYYGDEAGMWGADDPDDRKPMTWPEMTFEPESHHPLPGKTRPVDENGFDPELFNFYKKLIQIRQQHPVLKQGDFQFISQSMTNDLLVIKRVLNEQQAYLVFNRSPEAQNVTIPDVTASSFRDVWRNSQVKTDGGQLKVAAPARGFVILINDE